MFKCLFSVLEIYRIAEKYQVVTQEFLKSSLTKPLSQKKDLEFINIIFHRYTVQYNDFNIVRYYHSDDLQQIQ